MIGGDDELSSKFQDTAVGWVFFDDLDTLSCDFNPPILLLCIREELTQRSEALLRGLQNLSDQILLESVPT